MEGIKTRGQLKQDGRMKLRGMWKEDINIWKRIIGEHPDPAAAGMGTG